jgi:DNA (cytosine-5)-methyltransferase 1
VIQYGDKTGPLDTDGHTIAVAQPIAPTLPSRSKAGGGMGTDFDCDGGLVAQPVAFHSATEFLPQSSRVYSETEAAPTLQATGSRHGNRAPQIQTAMQVRRLTPVECERLQGFPDGYTNIPWRGKPESPDGPRYKALGNSMAVPVMRWIGERIQQLEGK